MRLVERSGVRSLPHDTFSTALKDMRSLYGGRIRRDKDPVDHTRQQILTVPDGLVSAHTKSGEQSTLVAVKALQRRESAGRWTALHAYLARGGVEFDYLTTEVPGVRGHQERQTRYLKGIRENSTEVEAAFRAKVDALIDGSEGMSDEEYERCRDDLDRQKAAEDEARDRENRHLDFFTSTSAGSGNEVETRFFNNVLANWDAQVDSLRDTEIAINQGDEVGLEMALRASAEADRNRDASFAMPKELPHTHTVFHARGDSLPAAAHLMADRYGDLLFHSDADPDATVAQALGAHSLTQLDAVWEGAMMQSSPLAAGEFVLKSFNQ